MRTHRRHLLARGSMPALALILGLATAASAVDERNLSSGLTAEGAPLALHGYDPVAYFTRSAPTLGSPEHSHVHEGATYYFASDANRKAFRADPAKYAPSYGGYCAFGVSVGKKFDGNPNFWTISEGRLHLNLNAEIERMFKKDVPGAVAKADTQWRKIEHRAVNDL